MSENGSMSAPVHAVVLQPVDEVLDAIYAFCDVLMHEQNMPVLDTEIAERIRHWLVSQKLY